MVAFTESISLSIYNKPSTTSTGYSYSVHQLRTKTFSLRPINRIAKSVVIASASDNSNRAILSFDVGTSSTKAALFRIDDNGRLGPVFRRQHSTQSNEEGQVTQKPSEWYKATIDTGRKALDADPHVSVVAIAVTGQMQDLIAVGESPPPLLAESCLLYSDARAQREAAILSSILGKQIPATGLLPKLRLLPRPENMSDYSLLLGAADYIVHALCADPKPVFTDATTASTTGLTAGLGHRHYDSNLLDAVGLGSFEHLLPEILETVSIVGVLSSVASYALGQEHLPGIPIIHAGGDAFSATMGAGEQPYVYGGTSGWTGACVASHDFNANNGVFQLAHASSSETSIVAGSVAAVGGALTAASELIGSYTDVNQLASVAANAPIGAGGVAWVPYLNGRRCPRPRDVGYAALCGVNSSTTREHVARAIVEGVTFAMAESAAEISHLLDGDVRVVGGVTKSDVFVKGISALIANEGHAIVGRGEVGIWGAGKAATRALGINIDADWVGSICEGGEIIRVSDDERDQWLNAWHRWQNAVKLNEQSWEKWSTTSNVEKEAAT